jgi:hypothetical protein
MWDNNGSQQAQRIEVLVGGWGASPYIQVSHAKFGLV